MPIPRRSTLEIECEKLSKIVEIADELEHLGDGREWNWGLESQLHLKAREIVEIADELLLKKQRRLLKKQSRLLKTEQLHE